MLQVSEDSGYTNTPRSIGPDQMDQRRDKPVSLSESPIHQLKKRGLVGGGGDGANFQSIFYSVQ